MMQYTSNNKVTDFIMEELPQATISINHLLQKEILHTDQYPFSHRGATPNHELMPTPQMK